MLDRVKLLIRVMLPPVLYGPIRAWRVRRFVSRYSSRVVEHTYAGYRLWVHLADGLGEGWYDRDWNEPAELIKLREGRLRPGARIVELGAHQGIVALILARIVGSKGEVIAVEAEPHNFSIALQNAKVNNADNLTIVHAAAAGEPGQLSFTEGLNGVVAERGSPGSIEVEAVTVDSLTRVYGHPDVVFIDVEGYEAHVLAGASETLGWGTTDVFVELHSAEILAAAGSTAQDVLKHLPSDTYEVSIALAGNTAPGVDSSQLESSWLELASGLHLEGERCFIVALAHDARSSELYPEVVDGLENEGGLPSRLIKTDAGVGRQESTPWKMFAGSRRRSKRGYGHAGLAGPRSSVHLL